MQTKIILAMVIIATAAGLAIAPSALNAMAEPNGSTRDSCVHNGNGDDRCGPGQSSTTVTCTKERGKYTCSSSR